MACVDRLAQERGWEIVEYVISDQQINTEWLIPRADDFDALLAADSRYLTRSAGRLDHLVRWCETHGKVIATSDITTDTAMGKAVAGIMSVMMELEQETALKEIARTGTLACPSAEVVDWAAPSDGSPLLLKIHPLTISLPVDEIQERADASEFLDSLIEAAQELRSSIPEGLGESDS